MEIPDSKSQQRHKLVHDAYLEIIKKHGDYAKYMPRVTLYNETAAVTGYSPAYIRQILRSFLKPSKVAKS